MIGAMYNQLILDSQSAGEKQARQVCIHYVDRLGREEQCTLPQAGNTDGIWIVCLCRVLVRESPSVPLVRFQVD